MHKGTIEFLFDLFQGEYYFFTESWDMNAHTPDDAMRRLEDLARVRAGLLAKNVRIYRLKVPKAKTKDVDMRGFGGAFACPWDRILTRRNLQESRHQLRGVPTEIFTNRGGVSSAGKVALAQFNKALIQAGVMQVRKGQPNEPIGTLDMVHSDPNKMGRLKKATKKDLFRFLGDAEGQKAWDARKAAKDADKA